MTEDEIKLAAVAYAAAMFNHSRYGSEAYEQRWGVVNELRQKLIDKHRALFPDATEASFSCGPGWWAALDRTFTRFEELMAEYPDFKIRIAQIKEKFGDLRMYIRIHHEDVEPYAYNDLLPEQIVPGQLSASARAAVTTAENETHGKCEVCGEPGEHDHAGWTKTLCPVHTELRQRMKA